VAVSETFASKVAVRSHKTGRELVLMVVIAGNGAAEGARMDDSAEYTFCSFFLV
jgi:hypothetical protein